MGGKGVGEGWHGRAGQARPGQASRQDRAGQGRARHQGQDRCTDKIDSARSPQTPTYATRSGIMASADDTDVTGPTSGRFCFSVVLAFGAASGCYYASIRCFTLLIRRFTVWIRRFSVAMVFGQFTLLVLSY
jgi:hypothetical protein